mgnify:CR=1 FL=1
MNTEHLSALESRDPAARESALLAALPAQVRAAQAVPAMAQILAGVDAAGVSTRAALAAFIAASVARLTI